MDDLDEFMDEVQTPRALVKLPEQFDDVVEIVVDEKRDASDALVAMCQEGTNEQLMAAL
jgi:hypothetical protein